MKFLNYLANCNHSNYYCYILISNNYLIIRKMYKKNKIITHYYALQEKQNVNLFHLKIQTDSFLYSDLRKIKIYIEMFLII